MNGLKETTSPILPLEQQRICIFRFIADAADRFGQILTPALQALNYLGEEGNNYFMIRAGDQCFLWEDDNVVIVPSQHDHYWTVERLDFRDEAETDRNPVVRLLSVMRWTSEQWNAQKKRAIYFKELTDAGISVTPEELKEGTLEFVLEDRDGQWFIHRA